MGSETISDFPRTYPLTTTWRIILVLGGIFFIGLAGMVVWDAWFPSDTACETPQHSIVADIILGALMLSISLLGVYAILASIGAQLTLYADAIETKNPLLKKRRLLHADIEGIRSIPSNPPSFKLIPIPGRGKSVTVSQIYKRDAVLDEWIKGLKDLDAADGESSLNEMFQSGALGSDREQGLVRLAQAQKITKTLGFVGMAIAFWLFFYPHPLELVLAVNVLAPIVALVIVAQSKGLYSVFEQQGGVRPSVAGLMLFPALMLALYALRTFSILDWPLSLQWVLGSMLVFSLIIMRIDRAIENRLTRIIPITLVLVMPYAYGLSTIANTYLDNAEAQIYSVVIADKHQTTGKSPTWKLTLSSWAERNSGDEVRVTPAYWGSVQVGDVVSIELHPGALHMPWYRVVMSK